MTSKWIELLYFCLSILINDKNSKAIASKGLYHLRVLSLYQIQTSSYWCISYDFTKQGNILKLNVTMNVSGLPEFGQS